MNSPTYSYDISNNRLVRAGKNRIEAINANAVDRFSTKNGTFTNFGNNEVLFSEGEKLSDSSAPTKLNNIGMIDYDFVVEEITKNISVSTSRVSSF